MFSTKSILRSFQPSRTSISFIRHSRYTSSPLKTIGIRRETKHKWERRVPLTPDHVEKLVKNGSRVIVQPSTNRVFGDDCYREAGAIVSDDLDQADIILGIKEIPIDQLLPAKTYLFFSHTHKAQPHNMAMLNDILKKKIRLIDYELITDENLRRLVIFGTFAGYAGMIDGLHSLGLRMLSMGYGSPFLHVGMAHTYFSLAHIKTTLDNIGKLIQKDGLSKKFGPLTFVFTGTGNVSKGAQEIFKCLPHEFIKPSDLKEMTSRKDFDCKKLYATVASIPDYIVPKVGKDPVQSKDFVAYPHKYKSVFAEKMAPYTTMLITGNYWDSKYPRLLTIDDASNLASLWQKNKRMLTIADISCDIRGSLEFMSHASTIDDPFYMYDPVTRQEHKNLAEKGVQIMSIDILPTELPGEASRYFSNALEPFMLELVKGNFNHATLKRATIAEDGKLQDRHNWIYDHLPKMSGASSGNARKRVIVLGSGYVSGPLIDYLARISNVDITICSNSIAEAKLLVSSRASNVQNRIAIEHVEVTDDGEKNLKSILQTGDIIVSLVPATLHPIVAKYCIELKKHMVTASYISPAIAALDEDAKRAGITILNEVGLDPGIDHLTSKKFIDEVQNSGGKIKSFISWCGGLPAPENADNPLRYKFSWSPKGVLLAAMNNAVYKWDNKLCTILGTELLLNAKDTNMQNGFAFEGIANRDSLKYIDLYNLGNLHDLSTMFRGTLRYKGYCELVHSFRQLGLMNTEPIILSRMPVNMSWAAFIQSLLSETPCSSTQPLIARRLSIAESDNKFKSLIESMEWLGMLSHDSQVELPNMKSISHLDILCHLLQKKLVYAPGERDMVCMQHVFRMETNTGKESMHTSTLVTYGDPVPKGYTAMAKTVGLPVAIATELILDGKVDRQGVIAPMTKDIYLPMLDKLRNEGIKFVEKSY